MAAIRVLVVDDSALVRQIVTHALSQASRIEVVGTARNGVEAIAAVRELKPDVVTLDIQMPEMDGLEALKRIVRESPARVIMLSSLDDPETTYKALELGAVEFIGKPREGMATSMERLSSDLVRAVRVASGIAPEKRITTVRPEAAPQPTSERAPSDPKQLV